MKKPLAAGLLSVLVVACSSTSPDAGKGPGAPGVADPRLAAAPQPVDPAERDRKAIAGRLAVGLEALRQNDLDRARRHISRALEIDDSSPEANNAMALYYRAEGDNKREEEHYRKAIRARGDYSQARNNYASLLYKLGRYDDAIEQLEKAAEDTTYDQRSLVFLNLGRCYARVGQPEKASSVLQRSLRLDTQQSDVFIELADVYLAQGNLRDAGNYYDIYVTRTRQTARSLWIGIRLAGAAGNKDKLASYEFQLEQMFRNTPEYDAWRAWKAAGSPAPSAAGTASGNTAGGR